MTVADAKKEIDEIRLAALNLLPDAEIEADPGWATCVLQSNTLDGLIKKEYLTKEKDPLDGDKYKTPSRFIIDFDIKSSGASFRILRISVGIHVPDISLNFISSSRRLNEVSFREMIALRVNQETTVGKLSTLWTSSGDRMFWSSPVVGLLNSDTLVAGLICLGVDAIHAGRRIDHIVDRLREE